MWIQSVLLFLVIEQFNLGGDYMSQQMLVLGESTQGMFNAYFAQVSNTGE